MHLQPNKTKYLFLTGTILFFLVTASIAMLLPHRANAQTALALLTWRFPYTDAAPLQTALAQTADTLFGFLPGTPVSILENQFSVCAIHPTEPQQEVASETQPTPAPKTQNGLPIVETRQTVAALKNTEGENKQIYVDNDTSFDISIAALLQEPLNRMS